MKAFISHSTKDMKLVDTVAHAARSACIEPYVAKYDDQPGTLLWQKIKTNIASSDCFIVLMTKDGSRSKWVQQEVAVADALHIPIIPLVEKGVNPKGVLEAKDRIELDPSDLSQGLKRVSASLDKIKTRKSNELAIGILALIGLALFLFSQSK